MVSALSNVLCRVWMADWAFLFARRSDVEDLRALSGCDWKNGGLIVMGE